MASNKHKNPDGVDFIFMNNGGYALNVPFDHLVYEFPIQCIL